MEARILVADDVPDIVDAVQMVLETDGYVVTTICDGTRVIPLMHEQAPDLLLLDIWMSGSDGREICQQIKQQEALCHIPVLLMSAHREAPDMAEQAGADGYILKPFTMNTLLATVATTLQKQQEEQLLTPGIKLTRNANRSID